MCVYVSLYDIMGLINNMTSLRNMLSKIVLKVCFDLSVSP